MTHLFFKPKRLGIALLAVAVSSHDERNRVGGVRRMRVARVGILHLYEETSRSAWASNYIAAGSGSEPKKDEAENGIMRERRKVREFHRNAK
jgi:hypothetical protein